MDLFCSLCSKNIIKYEITLRSSAEGGKQLLCDECFKKGDYLQREDTHVRVLPTCPTCGYTAAEYIRSGLLGCPNCYSALRSEVLPYVLRVQNGRTHKGKTPSGGDKYQAAEELRALTRQLDVVKQTDDREKIRKYQCKIQELKQYLFGYEED